MVKNKKGNQETQDGTRKSMGDAGREIGNEGTLTLKLRIEKTSTSVEKDE